MIASSPRPSRPSLALRVGVTGTRSLRNDQVPRLREQLGAVLAQAREEMERLARERAVSTAYARDRDKPLVPVLRFLSPLARGADRLAAEQALAQGYELYVPMPFPQAEYEKDFTGAQKPETGAQKPAEPPLSPNEDLAQFRALLARAGDAWLALDGDHSPEIKNRAYEAVGRFVVRHCDVLIAIWDGGPGGGRGGSAEIVGYAATVGVPVWWIHATENRDPVWIADIPDLRDIQDLRRPVLPATLPRAKDKLRAYLKDIIEPPSAKQPAPPAPRDRHSLIEAVARMRQDRDVPPEQTYFNEAPRPDRLIWEAYNVLMQPAFVMRKAYSKLIRWFSRIGRHGGDESDRLKPDQPKDEVRDYWRAHYEPPDGRAVEYANRYRSTYIWVFVVATFALLFGALALALESPTEGGIAARSAIAELVTLVLILSMVVISIRRDWHERSIEYRLLAELCRKQETLAPLGWALSIAAVQHRVSTQSAGHKASTSGAPKGGEDHPFAPVDDRVPPADDRAAWVAWLFGALQRAAPLPKGELASWLRSAWDREVLQKLIEEQLKYHERRRERARRAGAALEDFGTWAFLAVLIFVVLKLGAMYGHWNHSWVLFFGLMAVALPGLSAASIGLRAYAELQLLAEQSRHMEAELQRAQSRVKRLNRARPLVSQDLGAEAAAVAILMLQDLEGWARLFRVKGMELG